MKGQNIKGSVIYEYGKTLYFDKPQNTHEVSYQYDENENVTYIRVRANTYITEVLCCIVMILFSYILFTVGRYQSNIHIPNEMNYYDGTLFCDIVLDENSYFPVEYEIAGETGELLPGGNLYTLNVNDIGDTLTVKIKVHKFIDIKEYDYTIRIIRTY